MEGVGKSGPITLLHGTSTDTIGYLEEEGLKDAYLTDLPELAEAAAAVHAYQTHSDMVIVEVTIDDPSRLRPDDNMYREPMPSVLKAMGHETLEDYLRALTAGRYTRSRTWQDSLKTFRSVVYDGTIPLKNIRRLL